MCVAWFAQEVWAAGAEDVRVPEIEQEGPAFAPQNRLCSGQAWQLSGWGAASL